MDRLRMDKRLKVLILFKNMRSKSVMIMKSSPSHNWETGSTFLSTYFYTRTNFKYNIYINIWGP